MTNVLVVCRDPALKKTIREALSELPVRITKECGTGKEVPDAMTENPAELVIIDLFLPGTSGMEVLKVLQQMHGSAGCILLTRINTRGTIDRAFRYGARDVLVYPIEIDTLRNTVAHRLDLPIQLQPTPPAKQAAPAAPGKS